VAAWEKDQFMDELQNPHQPNISEGVFIPVETGQTGSMDRSDRSVRTVRPVPGTDQTGARDRSDQLVCSIPLYTIPSDG